MNTIKKKIGKIDLNSVKTGNLIKKTFSLSIKTNIPYHFFILLKSLKFFSSANTINEVDQKFLNNINKINDSKLKFFY